MMLNAYEQLTHMLRQDEVVRSAADLQTPGQ